MATHSSVLAWRIPGMAEPGGLPSLGSHRIGHDWSYLAAAAAGILRHLHSHGYVSLSLTELRTNILESSAKGWHLKPLTMNEITQFGPVQSLSRVRLFATPWITAHQASLSITSSQRSLKLMSTESVIPSSHLILCRPLLLLPPILPSIRVFSNKSTLCKRWPKYWSFSFSISPSNEPPGLISFRMDWLDLLAVQGTLKSLLQHHSSKASILQCSAYFTVQLSHPYVTLETP